MAEAIINYFHRDNWQAYSAGTKPAGYVHPKAITVLKELGIEHVGKSKSTDLYRGLEFDLVITVCDSAAEECPVWLGKGHKIHRSYPDPAKANGSEEEILSVFRSVRDAIKKEIPKILGEYSEKYEDIQ
jgi:arsenate reductase